MSIRLRFSPDDLALSLAVWVCTLPLLALIVVPRWGWFGAGAAAMLGLILSLTVCCLVLRRHGRLL